MRILQTLTVALALLSPLSVGEAFAVDANTCGYVQGNGGWYKSTDRSGPYSLDGNCLATLLGTAGSGSGGTGSSPSSPTYTAPSGVSITRLSCTLPAYSAGGNAVCTNEAGTQTTTACAANTACQIAAANTARKYAFASNATAGASISLGYTATVAPGNSRSLDGPSAAGGQGGFYEWQSPPTNAIYAATATANAVLVFEQGQ